MFQLQPDGKIGEYSDVILDGVTPIAWEICEI